MSSPLYRKAVPAQPQEDSASQTLRSRVERMGLAELRTTVHERQAAIVLAMRKSLKALESLDSSLYSRKWFEQRQDAIRAEARRALDDIETVAVERRDAIRELASEAAKRPAPSNSVEAMLFEQQITNAWTGLKMLLERARTQSDGLKAIEDAAASVGGDPVRIEALRRFGPDWVQGTFSQEPRYARERIQNTLTAAADAAEAPTLTPVQTTAREILAELDRGMGRLQVGTREVRKEIEGRGQIAAAIPGWDEGAPVIPLTHKGMPIPVEADSIVSAAFGPEARAFSLSAAKNYPMLSEQGALAGTVLDTSPSAQLYRRLGMNVAPGTGEPGQQ